MVRKSWCHALCLLLYVIIQGHASEGKNLYVSRVSGNDDWSCDPKKPCKTIWRAVTLASRGDHLHLDGTNTEKDPYTCQSGTATHTGIYINKSLSLTGFGPMLPQIRCSEGDTLRFDGSDDAQQTNITLFGLFLKESFLDFQDAFVNIESCKFEGSKRGLQFIISTRMISFIQITNSTFVGNKECISVIVNSTKNLSHQSSQVIFKMKNSSFYNNDMSDKGSGMSFSESLDNNQCVNHNITLENVAFSQNKFSSRGLVFLELENGNQNIDLHEVTFTDNNAISGGDVLTGYSHSEFLLCSTIVNVFVNASSFTGKNARSFDVRAANVSLQIYNASFRGHQVEGNGGVISIRGTDLCKLNVTNSSFVDTAAAQGGAINIECTKLVHVILQEDIFTGNAAIRGNAGAVFINVSASDMTNPEDTINDKVELNYNHQSGQLLHRNSSKARFTYIHSTSSRNWNVNAVKASGQVRHSTLTKWASHEDGEELMASLFDKIIVSIKNSLFSSNSACGYGGALHFLEEGNRTRVASQVTIERSTFTNNSAFEGGAICAIGASSESILVLEQVIMESNSATNDGGAAAIAILTLKVRNCRSLRNYVYGNGGVFGMFDINTLEVVDSLFVSNSVPFLGGGAFYIQPSNIFFNSILIINTTFENCSAMGGGAVFLQQGGNLSLVIKQSRFVKNRSRKFPGIGGALYISLPLDEQNDPGCMMETFSSSSQSDEALKYPSWIYKGYVVIEDTTFEENTARVGGAVYQAFGKAVFQNCHFVDNFAALQGGHIYTTAGSASLIIQDSSFLQTKKELHMGKMIYSQSSFVHTESSGALNISNTTMDARPYSSGNPLVKVENGRLVDVGRDNLTEFYCPVGSEMKVIHFTEQVTTQFNNTPCKIEVTALQFSCLTCTGNFYSLQRGHALGSLKLPGFKCLPCPFGANCIQNILAKRNFWGFEEQSSPPTLRFTMCPVGYCIPPPETNFPEYNGCQGNRSGELCGHCSKGFTETLYSNHCKLSHRCSDYWFWPVALVYVSLMALYFTFKPPVVPWIKRQILWFKENEPDDQDNNYDKGYLKILFYFYQAANVLLVSKYLHYTKRGNFIEAIVGVFNFKVLSKRLICPFPGLTAITKQLFSASHVFSTFVMICAFYVLHRGIQRIRGRGVPSAGPYIGGFLQTLLLGYTTLATVSFSLLRCVPIGSERRLFHDGNVVCFQWWQYILIAFVCIYVIPFVFVLLWGSYKLYGRTLTVEKFLLACFFPLPSIIYWLSVCFSRVLGYQANGHLTPSHFSKNFVERVLYDSFKKPEGSRKLTLSWESVMIGRRLILVMMKTLISDPLPRLLIMSLFCFLFLLHHVVAQPFRDGTANTVETISLLSIAVIATVNVFFASFLSLAVPLNDHFSSWWNVLHGVESVILCLVPAGLALLLVTAILSQLCRLAVAVCRVLWKFCWICFRPWYIDQEEEVKPLLGPVS